MAAAAEATEPPPPQNGDDENDETVWNLVEESAEDMRVKDGFLFRAQTRWKDLRGKRVAKARRNVETKPMSSWNRFRTKLQRMTKVHGETNPSQYRIPPDNTEGFWASFAARRSRRRKALVSIASFDVLLLHFLVIYFVLIAIFALLLQVFVLVYYNTGEQECVTNYDYSRVSVLFTDNYLVLFGLSWTTFSTVGYGVIGVSTEDGCQAIRYFLAIEAFFGVMYSGYSGALIFSNICGFLARAHVSFSSSICLQYGTGLTGPRVTFHKEGKARIQDNIGRSTPGNCPVVEMRLVNDRVRAGTAITEADIQCIVVLEEGFVAKGTAETGEDGDATINTCRQLDITPSSLPYFSHGSWHFQHILNENSPLLKDSVRDQLKHNGGEWPSDWNDWEKIRSRLSEDVQYIVVSMKGTSSLTSGAIFKSVQYYMEDIYIGYAFAELGYFQPSDKVEDDLAHCVHYDLSLINDIKPQKGGGNEPLGSDVESYIATTSPTASSDNTAEIDRRYVYRRGRRRRYDRLVRPTKATKGMKRSRRRWLGFSAKIRHCFKLSSSEDTEEGSRQFIIPPRIQRRWSSIVDAFFPKERPLISAALWLYETSLFNALLSFLFGYFIFVWVFALIIYALDPQCLSGWEDTPSGFVHSFYIPFQVSWTTFSTVGYGGVAPLAGEPCRGLSLILAGEAFVGVIYSSFCGSIFYAKLSRNESIANVSFATACCLKYGELKADAKPTGAKSGNDDAAKEDITNDSDVPLQFPFLEMRILNEDAQYKNMRGQILDAFIKCLSISFTLKLPHESEKSTINDEGRLIQNSMDATGEVQWQRICDELKVVKSRQVVFGKTPWSFHHVLDGTSPLLKSSVRKRIKELGCWPPELNDHEKIRSALSPEVNAIHVLFKGTSNRTSALVVKVHEYKPVDIFVGWNFAPLGYVQEKRIGDKTKSEVKFDRALLNDIVPQDDGKAEPIHSIEDDSSESDD